jgi:Domain of unknown function (DUF1707)
MEPQAEQQQAPAIRASDRERDEALQRLQNAFAEGRLDDSEFDQRMRTALAARTRADLEPLSADLPDLVSGGSPVAIKPGTFQLAYKNHLRRSGRWRVPGRYTSVVYKGGGVLDLRAAELSAGVTTIRAVAYKSTIEIVVPPGVRVEMGGVGVSSELDAAPDRGPDAAVVQVRGLAYKGLIVARARPSQQS